MAGETLDKVHKVSIIDTFQQGHIKCIKSDSKDFYIFAKKKFKKQTK